MVPRNFTPEDDETVCMNRETQRHAQKMKTDGLALYRGSNSVLCCTDQISEIPV
jgi:hypothetical protein